MKCQIKRIRIIFVLFFCHPRRRKFAPLFFSMSANNFHFIRPKIGLIKDQTDALRRHKKGCNCRRSGCLKNYCECHEAKVACSENCKCTGKLMEMHLSYTYDNRTKFQVVVIRKSLLVHAMKRLPIRRIAA